MRNKLVLASSSPRRQALLDQVNIPFTVRKTNIDESQIFINDPVEKVKQLASLKGNSIALQPDEIVLAADTVVAYNNHIFEKPQHEEEAREMMQTLSGEMHEVYTGVMIRSVYDSTVFIEQTKVTFWPLSEKEIESYITTDEPYDKAGGYGIQSFGAVFVKNIIGDYCNVVGLPLSNVVRELRKFNVYPEKHKHS